MMLRRVRFSENHVWSSYPFLYSPMRRILPYFSNPCLDGLRNVYRLTVAQNSKRIRQRSLQELFFGRVDGIIGQLKAAVVDSDAVGRAQNFMCSEGLFGSHMNRRHKPSRLVRPNR